MPRVQHHAIADYRQFAAAHDARWQCCQLEHFAVNHQRVPGIMSALKPHDHIGAFRQPIYQFAFPLVAPLGAHDNDVGHENPLNNAKPEPL